MRDVATHRRREGTRCTTLLGAAFIKGASIGALAFSVGGVEVHAHAAGRPTPRAWPSRCSARTKRRRSRRSATRSPSARREAGIAHFVDQQLTQPPPLALLSVRVGEVRPPYVNFLIAARLRAIDARRGGYGRPPVRRSRRGGADQVRRGDEPPRAQEPGTARRRRASSMRSLRNDAVDVVYGTVDGFARVGVPYLPISLPEQRW